MAGRYAITDATGISLRGEYIRSNDNYLGIAAPLDSWRPVATRTSLNGSRSDHPVGVAPGWYKEDQNLWSVTATLDHALTEHLSIKAEVVYQEGSTNHTANGRSHEQRVLLQQVVRGFSPDTATGSAWRSDDLRVLAATDLLEPLGSKKLGRGTEKCRALFRGHCFENRSTGVSERLDTAGTAQA